LFFNPATLSRGWRGRKLVDIRRSANLLQIRRRSVRDGGDGRHRDGLRAIYPALTRDKAARPPRRELLNVWWRPPEGYAFSHQTSPATRESAAWHRPVRSNTVLAALRRRPHRGTNRRRRANAPKMIGEKPDPLLAVIGTGPHGRVPKPTRLVRPRWCRAACRRRRSAPNVVAAVPPKWCKTSGFRVRRLLASGVDGRRGSLPQRPRTTPQS